MKESGSKKVIIDIHTAMRTFLDCIIEGLSLCYHSTYTGRSTPITAFEGHFTTLSTQCRHIGHNNV